MVHSVVLFGPRSMAVQDLALDSPRAGEVRVRMKSAGVCHSDLNIYNRGGAGPLQIPAVLGHEGAGEVVEVGPQVIKVKPGDQVILAVVPQCGACDYCRSGRPTLCTSGRISRSGRRPDRSFRFALGDSGVAQVDGLGTWSEEVVVPEAAAIRIDPMLPWPQAAVVGCAVVTGFGAAVNVADIAAGEDVVIIGCGGVGLNGIQGARTCGARRIIALDVRESALTRARRMGATHTINVSGESADIALAVRDLLDGEGAHAVLDFVGSQKSVSQAIAMARPGGRCVFTGLGSDEWTVQARDFLISGITLSANYMGMGVFESSFKRIAQLYQQGELYLDEMVSRVVKLDEIPDAFRAVEAGEVARCVVAIS